MATTRPQTPGDPRRSGHGGRRRAKGLVAFLRADHPRRTFGLIAVVLGLVLAAALTVAAVSDRDHTALPNPAPSAADQLMSSRAASPVGSPSASPSASPTKKASQPSRSSKAPAPAGVTVVDPGRANCAPKPSACGLPDATNTGVPPGTSLRTHSGDITVKTAGTVIDRQDIRGCVRVQAPGVVIRRSKIACRNFPVVASFNGEYSGTGLVVEDSEISCLDTNGTGLSDTNVTARRLDIHGCENGFDIDASFIVQDSYIHDLYQSSEAHTDGIQLAGGAHLRINHNTIFSNNGNSAIISHRTDNSDVVVSNNLMAGGAYTFYCPSETSQNFRVIGNRVATLFYPKGGAFGPWTYCEKVAERRGNIWDNDLKPL